jgi:hypothetical protein
MVIPTSMLVRPSPLFVYSLDTNQTTGKPMSDLFRDALWPHINTCIYYTDTIGVSKTLGESFANRPEHVPFW